MWFEVPNKCLLDISTEQDKEEKKKEYPGHWIIRAFICPLQDIDRVSMRHRHVVVFLRGYWGQGLTCINWYCNLLQVSRWSHSLTTCRPCISLLNLLQNLLPPVVFAYLLGKHDTFIHLCIETLNTAVLKLTLQFSFNVKNDKQVK